MDILKAYNELYGNGINALEFVRSERLAPESGKKFTRLFRNQDAAELLGLTPDQFRYFLKTERAKFKSDGKDAPEYLFPMIESGRNKGWEIGKLNKIREVYHDSKYKIFYPRRSEGEKCARAAVCIFKGGAGKSTEVIHHALHFGTRAYRVLVVDCDPQGTTTMQFLGFHEAKRVPTLRDYLDVEWALSQGDEVSDEDMVFADPKHIIIDTYAPGVDLLPANEYMYQIEIDLPVRRLADPSYKFIEKLNDYLDKVEEDYDVILLDTPPSMSQITLNAIFAANILLHPIPAEQYDYESSLIFFDMMRSTFETIDAYQDLPDYDVIKVITSKYGSNSDPDVEGMMRTAFRNYKFKNPILESDAIGRTKADRLTIFEKNASEFEGAHSTYKRATEMMKKVNRELERYILELWPSKEKYLSALDDSSDWS